MFSLPLSGRSAPIEPSCSPNVLPQSVRSSLNESSSLRSSLKPCVLFKDKHHAAASIVTSVLCGREERDGGKTRGRRPRKRNRDNLSGRGRSLESYQGRSILSVIDIFETCGNKTKNYGEIAEMIC